MVVDGQTQVGSGPRTGPRKRSPPAVGQAERGVLGVHTGRRLVGDQVGTGVGVAVELVAGLGVVDHRLHTLGGHLQRVLLRGGRDLPALYALDARAATIDRHDYDVLLLPFGLQRGVRAERGRLVYRVHEVDVRRLLQAVLHRGLPLGLV